MIAIRRPVYRGKHGVWLYREHAAKHVAQVAVLVIPATIALWTHMLVLPLLAALVGEALLLAVLPQSSRFRRHVDLRLAEASRARAAAARDLLVGRMSDEYRRELEVLERLAMRIQERTVVLRTGDVVTADEWLGFGRLFGAFVRLAIAHRTSSETFKPVNRTELGDHVARLELMLQSSTGASQRWVVRRLAIARRRIAAWERALEERVVMAHGIAMIGELVRWMHEQCAAAPTEPVRADLEEMLAAWEQNGATLRELSAICGTADESELEVFELASYSPVVTSPSARPGSEANAA
jgi:hypothetical protein